MSDSAGYVLTATLGTGFDDTVAATRAALAEQGFGVLTEIDIAATMKAKLGLELAPHLILGACNPLLASQALAAEPSIAVLLPCNVVVRDLGDGHTMVEAMDPTVMGTLTDNPVVTQVADQARAKLDQALAALTR